MPGQTCIHALIELRLCTGFRCRTPERANYHPPWTRESSQGAGIHPRYAGNCILWQAIGLV